MTTTSRQLRQQLEIANRTIARKTEAQIQAIATATVGEENLERLATLAITQDSWSRDDQQWIIWRLNAAAKAILELQWARASWVALELQLDTRIRELTVERDAARAIPPPVPATLCERKLECGGSCRFAKHHPPPCLCAGDVDGEPGTCDA